MIKMETVDVQRDTKKHERTQMQQKLTQNIRKTEEEEI